MKPLILNLISVTVACAALTACQPDRPIPQPIMLYRAELESAGAHDSEQDLQACRREVNQEAAYHEASGAFRLAAITDSGLGMTLVPAGSAVSSSPQAGQAGIDGL
jgi:hypothetical protein